MDGESGEWEVNYSVCVCVTSQQGVLCKAWRNETGSWFQRWGDAQRNERLV